MTRKLESERRKHAARVTRLEDEVARLEAKLEIERTWQPGDALYDNTVKYIATRKYQQALGRLQRLVILRLFELHKLNLSQTGTSYPSDRRFHKLISAQATRHGHTSPRTYSAGARPFATPSRTSTRQRRSSILPTRPSTGPTYRTTRLSRSSRFCKTRRTICQRSNGRGPRSARPCATPAALIARAKNSSA